MEQVLFAHFLPMEPGEVNSLLRKAAAYIDEIEVTMLRILAAHETAKLAFLSEETCRRMKRRQEFRLLNMAYAHVQYLLARGVIRQVDHESYQLLSNGRADGVERMRQLEGKVAVVTGSATGIGQAIAFALAKEGASVGAVRHQRRGWAGNDACDCRRRPPGPVPACRRGKQRRGRSLDPVHR